MSGNNFELNGLDSFIKNISGVYREFPKELQKLMDKYGAKILKGAKLKTPVDTGQLRNSWTLEKDRFYIRVFNNTEYAIHVEYGHRTRSGKSYIEGAYMLKTTYEKEIKKFLQELQVLLVGYGFQGNIPWL